MCTTMTAKRIPSDAIAMRIGIFFPSNWMSAAVIRAVVKLVHDRERARHAAHHATKLMAIRRLLHITQRLTVEAIASGDRPAP
jgi:hypothetical protein